MNECYQMRHTIVGISVCNSVHATVYVTDGMCDDCRLHLVHGVRFIY
jgi:hypothetical protein